MIIGPDFDVYAYENATLDIDLIDASMVELTDVVFAIIDAAYIKSNIVQALPFIIIYINHHNRLKQYFSQTQTEVTLPNPCDFKLIKNGAKIGKKYVFLG